MLDGEFKTKCERLAASNNPNLPLMNYDLQSLAVVNPFIVPKHFFVRDIIEERWLLAATGWSQGPELQMRNCASANLEIPGSMLRIAPE